MTRSTVGTVQRRGSVTQIDRDVRDAVLDIMLETDGYTGERYFERLTETVALHFGVHSAYLCELSLDFEKAYPIASYVAEKSPAPIEFFARGACEAAIERGGVVQGSAVVQQFPDDAQLKALHAEAVVGTVLRAESGDPIGVFFLVHREPLPQADFVDTVLQAIAPRAGAELERRQHEMALKRSEGRLRLLTDRSKDVLFYYQLLPRVEVQYVSPAVETVFGMRPEAFHANPELIFTMLDAEDRSSFERAISSGSEEPVVARIRLPNGQLRWLEYCDFAVRDHQGRLAGIGGTVRDITSHVEMEEALRSSERYLRGLLEAIPDTLLLVKSDGEVLDYVPGEVDTGLPAPESTRGKNLRELMSPALVGVLERTVRSAARSHRVQRVEFEVPGEQRRFFDARCLPFGDASLLLVLRDLTAQKWHEEEEKRQRIRDDVDDRVENRTKANPYGLTYRELAVLHLVVQGMADKQIADALGISIYTVNKHVGNVLGKMNAVSRTEAGVRAVKEGLLLTRE